MNKRRKELGFQFKNALESLSVSLRAGYSIENGLIEAERDMRKWNGDSSEIVQELSYINRQIKMSIPAEDLLTDLGIRSDVEDIKNFASVFAIARKMGGNMVEIVQDAADQIREKAEVERSIETTIAAKKFEQTIMAFMPCGIIFYMQITTPEFFEHVYGTLFGVLFMTGCLILYTGAFYLGRRLVQIEV
jgi:tight adherence protein B